MSELDNRIAVLPHKLYALADVAKDCGLSAAGSMLTEAAATSVFCTFPTTREGQKKTTEDIAKEIDAKLMIHNAPGILAAAIDVARAIKSEEHVKIGGKHLRTSGNQMALISILDAADNPHSSTKVRDAAEALRTLHDWAKSKAQLPSPQWAETVTELGELLQHTNREKLAIREVESTEAGAVAGRKPSERSQVAALHTGPMSPAAHAFLASEKKENGLS